ncbi:PAS domain S-box-containing protein [Paucimonas lemoignei]|uniref:PAS domain S-box-containing protein n=1 Tax=Paucimonas lemoignei TaxID=29443 RepID=A0A4R3HS53_PAULE|nr:PAS domain S-box protein [Paucimonas lemoignei]TCS32752.1 PAS domain S-box-containing protein [Paucimonas lemoignei]
MKKKWTIKLLVLTGFIVAVLFLALLSGIVWDSMMTSMKVNSEEDHSNAVLLATEKISSSMALAIAAHRGYMLNGDQESLLQRDAALEALDASVASLADLVQDDLELQAYLQQLQTIIPEKIDMMKQGPSRQGSERLANVKSSNASSAQLQEIFSRITTYENQRHHRLDQEKRAGIRRTQISAAMLVSSLAILLTGLYLLINHHLRRDELRMELEKSEALLRQVLELMPVGVVVIGPDRSLSMANPAAHEIMGTSPGDKLQLPWLKAWDIGTGESITQDKSSIVRALEHGEVTLNQEVEIMRANDGQRRILRTSAMPLRDNQQKILGAITVSLDVTDLKRTEKALQAAHDAMEARVAMRTRELVVANAQLKSQIEERRRAEDTLRQTQNILTIAQRTAHVGSWEINLVTQEAQWSDEFFRICGLEPGSIKLSIPAGFDLIHPEDRRRISAAVNAAVEARREYSETLRVVRPDGTIRHVLLQGEPVPSGYAPPTILIGSMLDITEQKQNEEMLRQLAVHQEVIKEEERKRIAREIHDEMGQNLLALRIDVSMLHARTAKSHPKLHHKVETVLNNIDNTIKSVRAIINNLRPVVLDLGLYASLQWQIEEFQRRTGIVCELFAKADELDRCLTEEQTTTLFRILQESLTNVARHANAGNVNIALDRKGSQLFMRIADDGVGMYPGDRRKSKSFGLLGIRERISAIGGQMTVESIVGQGTVLVLSVPLNTQATDEPEPPHRLQA